MNELEFSEVVAAVCKRPRMYMPVGTLGHIISYLEGYSKAALVQAPSHSGLSGFRNWLLRKFKRSQESTAWEELFDCSSSDEAVLNSFAELYAAYANSVAFPT